MTLLNPCDIRVLDTYSETVIMISAALYLNGILSTAGLCANITRKCLSRIDDIISLSIFPWMNRQDGSGGNLSYNCSRADPIDREVLFDLLLVVNHSMTTGDKMFVCSIFRSDSAFETADI